MVTSEAPVPSDRTNNYPPLKGGIQIYRLIGTSSRSNCSSAFIGQRTGVLGTEYFIIFAGHCGSVGHSYFHFIYGIGDMTADTFEKGGSSTNADAGAIAIRATDRSNDVYFTASSVVNITSTMALNNDRVGDPVCMSGAKQAEGNICGAVTSVDTTVNYTDYPSLTQQRLASYPSIPGDSGGAHYYANRAVGIQSGNRTVNGDTDAIYTHLPIALSRLGMNVRTQE